MNVDPDKLGDTLVQLVASVIPLLAVVGVFWLFKFVEARQKQASAQVNETLAAVMKLWPFISADSHAAMIAQEPAAYTAVSAYIVEQTALNKLKGDTPK